MYYVYITTTKNNTLLYIGVTNNIERRIAEHKSGMFGGYTAKYHVNKLVYVEEYGQINEAIRREKQLKKWSRGKKECLIDNLNPTWRELSWE